ncbi:hypothetical protein [Methanosphaera sp.]
MSGGGDNSTGAGGSWTVQSNIIVCSDSNTGAAQLVSDVVSAINSQGKTATSGGVGPSSEYKAVKGKTNTTVFFIVNGVDHAMCYEFYTEAKSTGWMGSGNNLVVGFHTGHPGACNKANYTNPNLQNAHDAGYASASMRKNMMGTSSADWMAKATNCGWVAGPDANSLATSFLTGAGASGSSVEVVEGFIESGRGGAEDSSPQFWNYENYEPYTEIPFTNFSVVEEFPRTQTADFETTENIDLTSGRVAVMIAGDCNTFGGIILSKSYNSSTGLYTYKCQGFMERIMANNIYAVYNGSKTVYDIIKEVLADIGLPDTGLLKLKEYDTAITEENKKLLQADKKLTETSSAYDPSTSTSDNSSLSKDKLNPFKKKPKGIYNKPTIYEYICTLLFEYGVNVDFYGDANGIPHFDLLDLEAWKKDVWMFNSHRGFETNYDLKFDITDAVTQVAVKNISATNATGEIYTAEELLGVKLENYIGRMGVIVDNPTKASATTNTSTGEYQDKSGKKYTTSQMITSTGKPSCNKCTSYNGGKKPTYQGYTKYWYNLCPSCEEEGSLEYDDEGDGVITCSECETEFCTYCGYDKKKQKKQLTELFKTSTNNSLTTTSDATSEES